MKNRVVILLLICLLPNGLFGQTKSVHHSPWLSVAKPEDVGMSVERLDRIDRMCLEAIDSNKVPGVVALVARNGKIVYYKAFGKADNQSGRASKADDIFRIASMTKAVTATAVMMLWEEGRFGLDEPIKNYIPEFADVQVLDTLFVNDSSYLAHPASKPISIRHLLTHTSGLGYGMIDGDERFRKIYSKAGVTDLFSTDSVTIKGSVQRLAKLPLHHDPGADFTYSEGLDVLGRFVEIVSGMPLDEFFRKRIFDPLGMDDTWFYLPKQKTDRLVPVQHLVNGQWERYPVTFYDPEYPIKGAASFFSGGAGLCSTAKDYATFLQMYLNGGELNGIRLLSRTTVRTILANHTKDLFWGSPDRYYGLAFEVVDQSGEDKGGWGSKGTFSWAGYFNTQYFADPQENVIGILMKQTQGNTGDNTGKRFRQLVGQAIDD